MVLAMQPGLPTAALPMPIMTLANSRNPPAAGAASTPMRQHLPPSMEGLQVAFEPATPPLNRASMVPQRWSGFWQGLRAGKGRQPASGAPWQQAAARRRSALRLGVLLAAGIAAALMAGAASEWSAWLFVKLVLLAVLTGWVAAGFLTALMGALVAWRGDPQALSAAQVAGLPLAPGTRTAIIMPICNEQVLRVFAGLRATCESLLQTGHARQFDVFVLSDSSDAATCAEELAAWQSLRAAMDPALRVFYRWRRRRVRRKAGNVADFCRRWGRDYDYFIVLDADSVMSGDCLVGLAKLMDRHPRIGILQTAPATDGIDTLHARIQQFASRMAGRLFTAGMSYWQLGESHYWGHNAILRSEAFIRHCSLARLPGRGGLSGDILSHDFIEAALMRRAGYEVWLVPDLGGSYEQQPPNLAEELRRDRRWCQGNLMNLRLLAEPGLAGAHRWMLFTGALSYLASPLWLVFLLVSALAWQADGLGLQALALFACSASLLLVPKLLAVALIAFKREAARHGGWLRVLSGVLLEAFWSLLLAPVRMAAHTLFCLAALTGIEIRWQSPPREAAVLPLSVALRQFGPFAALAAAASVSGVFADPAVALWLLPVTLPLLASPFLAIVGSREDLGSALRRQGLLCTPEEIAPPALLRRTRVLAHATLHPVTRGQVAPLPVAGSAPAAVIEERRRA